MRRKAVRVGCRGGHNQYFIYFSMLNNLWPMLHICQIYSNSLFLLVMNASINRHRCSPPSVRTTVMYAFVCSFVSLRCSLDSVYVNLFVCFICKKTTSDNIDEKWRNTLEYNASEGGIAKAFYQISSVNDLYWVNAYIFAFVR